MVLPPSTLCAEIVENVAKLSATYGDIYSFWLANRLVVFISDADYIETIMNAPQCVEKGASYKFLADLTGDGLITLKGTNTRQCVMRIVPLLMIRIRVHLAQTKSGVDDASC